MRVSDQVQSGGFSSRDENERERADAAWPPRPAATGPPRACGRARTSGPRSGAPPRFARPTATDSVAIQRLERVEPLEFERLGVGQADAHAVAEGIEREGVERVVVVRHAPRINAGRRMPSVRSITYRLVRTDRTRCAQHGEAVTARENPRSRPAAPAARLVGRARRRSARRHYGSARSRPSCASLS